MAEETQTDSKSTTALSSDTERKSRAPSGVQEVDSKDMIDGEIQGSPSDTYDGPPPGKMKWDEVQAAKQARSLVDFAKTLREMRLEDERKEKRIFGFVPRAELLNGRVAMFFFIVGFLTEYWTGYSLLEQVELLFRTLGVIN